MLTQPPVLRSSLCTADCAIRFTSRDALHRSNSGELLVSVAAAAAPLAAAASHARASLVASAAAAASRSLVPADATGRCKRHCSLEFDAGALAW